MDVNKSTHRWGDSYVQSRPADRKQRGEALTRRVAQPNANRRASTQEIHSGRGLPGTGLHACWLRSTTWLFQMLKPAAHVYFAIPAASLLAEKSSASQPARHGSPLRGQSESSWQQTATASLPIAATLLQNRMLIPRIQSSTWMTPSSLVSQNQLKGDACGTVLPSWMFVLPCNQLTGKQPGLCRIVEFLRSSCQRGVCRRTCCNAHPTSVFLFT